MDLPYEVLVYLFKYIPKADRKSASETCRSWYLAANDYCFLKNKVVIFYKTILNDEDSSPIQIFEKSSIIYQNYLFNEVEVSSRLNEFWEKIGETIKSLTLRNCDICEKVYVYMLQMCTNLEVLKIERCIDLYMSRRLLEGKTEGLLDDNLDNLRILSLSGNQYLTDALFNRFVAAAPSLEELNLSSCFLQFHLGLVKKFYPPDTDIFINPSESVLTFYFVLQFIIMRAEHIKRLLFSNTLIDGAALKSLAETKNLQLQSLEVHGCDQLTNTGLLALTTHQTSLKELDIGLCTRVTDQSLVYICKNLVNLEYLNIQRCRAVTDLGIAHLSELKKLKSLNISQCELITKEGIQNGVCYEENGTIEELDIHSLNLDQTALIMISEKLPNLRFLDISYCFNAVTDTSIQVVFKNQVFLHTLKMSHCDKVSDAGLTGMGKVDTKGNDGPIMSTYDESSSCPKIHLGSRAEEEIMRDARRKYDVMLMCEKLTMDSFTGYSLARTKGLKELDISGCNRITDVSLTYAFNFKELVNLNLSRCEQITHAGIAHLVKNCPSIEYFNLIGCYNLEDEAVTEIVKRLRRLQRLELRICDADLNILYVDASFPGACHDAHVWNSNVLRRYLENINNSGESCWLLGDSGYPQRSFMMTPILGAVPGSPEELYTTTLCRARNSIERCFGLLKTRWRCLLAHRTLHYDPIKAGKIVNACVVLHNMCNAARVAIPEYQEDDRRQDAELQIPILHHAPGEGREGLVQILWQRQRRGH